MAKREVIIKEVRDGVDGAPPWITTFVDMISLLVTFFILLYTFSSIREYDTFSFPGTITDFKGVLDETPADTIKAPESDVMMAHDVVRGARVPHQRPLDALLENMEEMGQRLDQNHQVLNLEQIGSGLRITYGPRESFDPNSNAVGPALAKSLNELGKTLKAYTFVVLIEGFVDDAFRATPEYEDGQALSLARAEAAAQSMVDSGFDARRLQVVGCGREAIAANATSSPESRQLERRVEVRIIPGAGPFREEGTSR